KAVCNLSENNRWPELLLRSVIRWFDVAVPHEDEQLVAGIDDDCIAQMATLGVGWLELEQPVELALKFARVLLYRAIGEIGSAAADLAGTLQELLEWRGGQGSPGNKRVVGITDEMRKADLVFVGVIRLRGEAI